MVFRSYGFSPVFFFGLGLAPTEQLHIDFLDFCGTLAGQNASFEIQLDEKPGNITWLKDNRPLDDRLADRITTTELPGNYYRLEIKHCWYVHCHSRNRIFSRFYWNFSLYSQRV